VLAYLADKKAGAAFLRALQIITLPVPLVILRAGVKMLQKTFS